MQRAAAGQHVGSAPRFERADVGPGDVGGKVSEPAEENANQTLSTREEARQSCGPFEIRPILARGVAYDPGYVGSPSVESLFALRMELVPLIDSRNA